MVSQRFEAVRRVCRHLIGRHTLYSTVAGSLSGHWLWHASCSCGLVRRGAELTQHDAEAAAALHRGRRDVLIPRHAHGSKQVATLWPEVSALRVQANQLVLPEQLRGRGHVVACDGSLRASDGHAGWAAITDTGWWLAGVVPPGSTSIDGLELLAIANGLRLYPMRQRAHVWSDNPNAREMARRILAGKVGHFAAAPNWVPYHAWKLLRATRFRHVRVQIVAVKSKTVPLHDIADHLARRRPLDALIRPNRGDL